jgi:uncharacterized SAM-binding protein YcdF (DUF218 family)
LQPGNALLVLAIVGATVWRLREKRGGIGFRLTVIALGVLAAIAVLPIGKWMLLPLENRFPQSWAWAGPIDGIVLLGGTIQPWLSDERDAPQLNGSAERLIEFVKLGRRHPEATLVFTGGSGLLTKQHAREADSIHALVDAMGLEPARVIVELESRNTAENATFTKALIKPQPGEVWLLITSASHMPRSVGVFREAGWPVFGVPVDYRTDGRWDFDLDFSLANGLELITAAAHEWLGLLAYRLTGRTDSLFPAP